MKAWVYFLLLLALTSSAWGVRWEKDDTGRAVAIPDQVHRAVSLSPSITNTIYGLGAASQLAGITDYTIYPAEAAQQKPSVGTLINPSLERIIVLHPDIVLALPEFTGAATIEGLKRVGIPVFLLKGGNVANIYRTITTVGRVLGRERESVALVSSLRSREEAVRAQSAGKRKATVLLVLSVDPLITAGRNAFITEMFSAVGTRSVTEDLPQDWLQINIESVLPRKPDYIVVMKDGPVMLKELQQRAGWNSLEAVRKGRVIVADDRIQVAGPVAFDGLEDFAQQIHAMQSH